MARSDMSKHTKHSDAIDMISSLPEPLLSHILSLLPTKYAVATSILSTRWKFLWTSITNLEFNCYEAFPRIYLEEEALKIRSKKFTQFVSRVLLLLNPPCIQNFQLKCHHEFCVPLDIESLVCAAIGRTVQKLELDLMMTQSIDLPLSHFHCKTLAVLKLDGDIHFKIAAEATICFPNLLTLHLSEIEFTVASNCSVSFPSLKDLLLDSVRYTNEESVNKLFASSFTLENLIINRTGQDNVLSLIICIPSLISLTISFQFQEFDFHWGYRLHIDTPALEYLHVFDDSMCYFTSENSSSLLKASIHLELEYCGMPIIDAYSANICKFIGSLFNVKSLSILGQTLEVISSMSANIAPVFHNLKRLKLDCYSCSCWSVVLNNLLERMDNLKHLVLTGRDEDSCQLDPWWMEPLRVPVCLLLRVKTIYFTDLFCGCSDELELISYFLKNAKVLKMLTVKIIEGSDKEKLKLMRKILMSPRGSHECQVDVESDEEDTD